MSAIFLIDFTVIESKPGRKVTLKACWASGIRGISAHCIIMLFWTAAQAMSSFSFSIYSDGRVICKYDKKHHLSTLGPCQFWIFYFPLLKSMRFWEGRKTPILIQNRRQTTLLFHIWLVVGLTFPLSFVKRTKVLNITMCPTGLNHTFAATATAVDNFLSFFLDFS